MENLSINARRFVLEANNDPEIYNEIIKPELDRALNGEKVYIIHLVADIETEIPYHNISCEDFSDLVDYYRNVVKNYVESEKNA